MYRTFSNNFKISASTDIFLYSWPEQLQICIIASLYIYLILCDILFKKHDKIIYNNIWTLFCVLDDLWPLLYRYTHLITSKKFRFK